MRRGKFAELYRRLGEDEDPLPGRRFGPFRLAGVVALAAFALAGCGDDDSPEDLFDDDPDDTRTATATGTGPNTATATATGGPTDPNTFTATGAQTDPNTITDPGDPTIGA